MIQFNLLPWREKERRDQKILFGIRLAASSVAGIVFLLLVHLMVNMQVRHQLQRNNYLQSIIDNEYMSLFAINAKKKNVEEMESELSWLMTMRRNNFRIIKLLDALPRIMPDSVTLQQLRIDGSTIILSGKSVSSMQVTQLMENMKKSNVFEQTTLADINAKQSLAGEERYFQIEAVQNE